MGTQKNCLNEMGFFEHPNLAAPFAQQSRPICAILVKSIMWNKKIITILTLNNLLNWSYDTNLSMTSLAVLVHRESRDCVDLTVNCIKLLRS